MMQLSKETLAVFKNFATINGNLTLKEGNEITTITVGKNLLAKAVVAESFPSDFGIYDLNEFLGALSLFENPDLDFHPNWVTIKEGKHSIKYYAANQSVLTPVPQLKPFPPSDIDFTLTSAMLGQIQKVSSVLRVTDLSVVGEDGTMKLVVWDKSNPTGNTFDTAIGETDKEFKVNFKVENLKLMGVDYDVSIGAKKIARFKAKGQDLMYYGAIELDSTFSF